jgi:uncharacterized protein (TIGR02271 family)
VEELFYDEETNRPEWIGIGSGFFGTKRVLVPVQSARVEDDAFRVPYEKDRVKGSPDVDSDEISTQTERELYAYYGLEYSESLSDTGLPAGAADSPGDTESGPPQVTRSEEELQVGTRKVESGRVRLRKWVETEAVAVDVELQQEAARVTRERVEQPISAGEIGDEEIEVPLRGEEAVVQKQAVAKERVSVGKTVETERQTVSDEVRKERVEVEGDGLQRP